MSLNKNFLYILLYSLSACSAKESIQLQPAPVLKVVNIDIDESLLTCREKPKYLSGNYTQKDVALFINDIDSVLDDCKSKLSTIKAIIHKHKNS